MRPNQLVNAARARPAYKATAALVWLVIGACGDDDPTQKIVEPNATCTAAVMEADLQADPLAGPGVDPATGKLRLAAGQHYVVSSTYGVPRAGAGGAKVSDRYLELFSAIQTQLESQPGLLAMQLGESDGCGSGRTLAVWSSEEEMYDFVTSKPHLEAMKAASEVLQPGYAVTHWDAATVDEMTFARAAIELARQ